MSDISCATVVFGLRGDHFQRMALLIREERDEREHPPQLCSRRIAHAHHSHTRARVFAPPLRVLRQQRLRRNRLRLTDEREQPSREASVRRT